MQIKVMFDIHLIIEEEQYCHKQEEHEKEMIFLHDFVLAMSKNTSNVIKHACDGNYLSVMCYTHRKCVYFDYLKMLFFSLRCVHIMHNISIYKRAFIHLYMYKYIHI